MATQSGIYRLRCLSTDKVYIGSSANVRKRWKEHLSALRLGKHHNMHLQRAWDKYGAEAFAFEIVELVEADQLLDREQYWFDETRCCDREYGFNSSTVPGRPEAGSGDASGTTIRRVNLSEQAAQELRRRATITTTRYRKQDADAAASDILEHLAAGRLLLISPDLRAALPWLETARAQCFHEDARRGLDQLIAALATSPDPHRMS